MIFDKWKQEWFRKKQVQLENEFKNDFDKMVSTFEKTKKEHEEKFNEELKQQLMINEAKLSTTIWAEAFTCGFSKAWDMMFLQNDGMEKVKKLIEDKAINDTLSRMKNGNNKKIN